MRKAIVLMAIGILAIMPLIGCTSTPAGGDGSATPPPTLAELQQQISTLSSFCHNTLNGKVTNLESEVGTLKTQQAYDDTELRQSIATLQTSLDALVVRVAALEEPSGGSNGTVEGTTRWSWRGCDLVTPVENVTVGVYDTDPSRIEEEGIYDVVVLLTNNRKNEAGDYIPVSLTDAQIELVLEPRDYCMIDEDNTYLDSDSSPWLWWDTDFVIKTRQGVEVCKSITFASEKHGFVIEANSWLELELVLELYYI